MGQRKDAHISEGKEYKYEKNICTQNGDDNYIHHKNKNHKITFNKLVSNKCLQKIFVYYTM